MTEVLTFSGIVQGIGFRPSAQRIALELGIKGQVKNSGGNAELIICGSEQALDEFVRRLIALFDIKTYTRKTVFCRHFNDFKIVHSEKDNSTPFLTPDIATCSKCEKELFDKSNRRFYHPFISCVDCGPRYTIIKALPYDRENITMSDFKLCEKCEDEYKEPHNRRCHAQTIACNDCGPEISISIDEAVNHLSNGNVLAVKGIGGYHLACKAHSPYAVKKIRKIKGREAKPFAVMFSGLDEISEYCFINEKEKELLLSSARPIVLLKTKKDFPFEVCKGSEYTGAFLPCNPIQLMILKKVSPLVMTSANTSGEPIITDDNEIKKLGVKVLSHNREILTPLDDSVLFVNSGRIQFVRRARGYVPLAIEINKKAECDTLCLGGDLKSAFAFHRDNYVFLSQHFGDLEYEKNIMTFKNNIKRFSKLHGFSAEKTVADAHPAYNSSHLFKNDLLIQHHKAHIASVIAEHKLSSKVLGFAFDGTGYGDDGAVWGSEVILFDENKAERLNHLEYIKMPAGDEISKNADLALDCYMGTNPVINSAVKNGINIVSSSSMGRLFDAVCALLDIKHYNNYEGECASALEAAAGKADKEYFIPASLNPVKILKYIKESKSKASACELALGFHKMICRLIAQLALQYKKEYNVTQAALSGGVFNNRIITANVIPLLEENGFKAYINEQVPCGDGGIALGQAYMAAMEV